LKDAKQTTDKQFSAYWYSLVLSYPSFQPHDVEGIKAVYRKGLSQYPIEVLDSAVASLRNHDQQTIAAGYKPTFPTLSEIQDACERVAPKFEHEVKLAVLCRDVCIIDQVKGSNVQCACKNCRPDEYCAVIGCTESRQFGRDSCWRHVRGIEDSGPVKPEPVNRNLKTALAEVADKKKMP
jgi:hypothetical protein